MALTLTNNSNAVISKIAGVPNGTSQFTITEGSLPLFSGETLTATFSNIINNEFSYFGSQNGQISLFIEHGACQIELYKGTTFLTSIDASSGWATITTPVLLASDTISITCKNDELPVPSQTPTPSVTASNTPTPTVTPTNTGTPTPTPSGAGGSTPQSLGAVYFVDFTDSNNVILSGGTNYVTDAYNSITSKFDFSWDTYYSKPDLLYVIDGYDTGYNAVKMSGQSVTISTGLTKPFSAYTQLYLIQINESNAPIASVYATGAPRNAKSFNYATDKVTSAQYTSSGSTSLNVNYDYTVYGQWNIWTFRSYQDATLGAVNEIYLNNSMVASGTGATSIIRTITPEGFYLPNSAPSLNTGLMALGMFFDKKLTEQEMTDMYNYIQNNY